MRFLLRKYLIITISLFALKEIITAIKISGSWQDFFYASVLLAFLYLIFRPIANLIVFPINLLTLNLFSWILNILIFYLWTLASPSVKIGSWDFPGFAFGPVQLAPFTFVYWQVLAIAAIFLTIIIQFFNWLIK